MAAGWVHLLSYEFLIHLFGWDASYTGYINKYKYTEIWFLVMVSIERVVRSGVRISLHWPVSSDNAGGGCWVAVTS